MIKFFKKKKPLTDLTNKVIIKSEIKKINNISTPVENYIGVLQYICDCMKRIIRLTKYLKDELTVMFGKHNTRYRGEFFYYVWIVEFDGEVFEIFTHKIKGTCFQIISERETDKSEVCINFLRKIEEMMATLQNK